MLSFVDETIARPIYVMSASVLRIILFGGSSRIKRRDASHTHISLYHLKMERYIKEKLQDFHLSTSFKITNFDKCDKFVKKTTVKPRYNVYLGPTIFQRYIEINAICRGSLHQSLWRRATKSECFPEGKRYTEVRYMRGSLYIAYSQTYRTYGISSVSVLQPVL
jgi:hypothetical protein